MRIWKKILASVPNLDSLTFIHIHQLPDTEWKGLLCSTYPITLWTGASTVVIIMLDSYYRLRVNY